jgi:hypothetical protein
VSFVIPPQNYKINMNCKNIFAKKPEFNFLSPTLFPKVFFPDDRKT